MVKETDIARATWTDEDIANGEKYSKATLELVWAAHKAGIVNMEFIGDYNDLLTGTEDSCIQTWSRSGLGRGILTRGRGWDNVFPPRWVSPINLELRSRMRMEEAISYHENLGLDPFLNVEKYLAQQFEKYPYLAPKGSRQRRRGVSTPHHAQTHNRGFSFAAHESGAIATHHGHDQIIPILGGNLNTRSQTISGILDDCQTAHDRKMILLQLAGEVTYELSNKDIANSKLAHKHKLAMDSIATIGLGDNSTTKKKKKVRKGRRSSVDIACEEVDAHRDESKPLETNTDHRYYESVTLDTDALMADIKRDVGDGGGMGGGKKKMRSRYDIELAMIDARDPHNWEIQSPNRQRSLYGHLYGELD